MKTLIKTRIKTNKSDYEKIDVPAYYVGDACSLLPAHTVGCAVKERDEQASC